MATCKTCGTSIEVPEGWSIGPAVRKHYWEHHPERMERTRADRMAEATMPPPNRSEPAVHSSPGIAN